MDVNKFKQLAEETKKSFESFLFDLLNKLLKEENFNINVDYDITKDIYGLFNVNVSVRNSSYYHLYKAKQAPSTDPNAIKREDRTFLNYVINKFSENFPFVTKATKFENPKKTYSYLSNATKVNYYFTVSLYHMEETGAEVTGSQFVEKLMRDTNMFHHVTHPDKMMGQDEFEALAPVVRGKLKPDSVEVTLYPKYDSVKKKKTYTINQASNGKRIAVRTIYRLYRKGIFREV